MLFPSRIMFLGWKPNFKVNTTMYRRIIALLGALYAILSFTLCVVITVPALLVWRRGFVAMLGGFFVGGTVEEWFRSWMDRFR